MKLGTPPLSHISYLLSLFKLSTIRPGLFPTFFHIYPHPHQYKPLLFSLSTLRLTRYDFFFKPIYTKTTGC